MEAVQWKRRSGGGAVEAAQRGGYVIWASAARQGLSKSTGAFPGSGAPTQAMEEAALTNQEEEVNKVGSMSD